MAIFTAMIALGPDPSISATDIQHDFGSNWPNLPITMNVEKHKGVLSFRIGDSEVSLGHMPAPIPWSSLEGPCATSFLWPNASKELRPHMSHLIVVASGKSSKLELAKLATQITAAVLGTCTAAIGVYWGSATLVVPAKIFREFAIEVLPTGPPIQIWIDFRVGKNEQGKSIGFTHGLAELGFMEMETGSASESPVQLRDRLWSLATYLLEKGPVIKDGDTVGQDAKEKIRVVYSPSIFGHPDQVMRLDYQSA
jgi:hypothetical protein